MHKRTIAPLIRSIGQTIARRYGRVPHVARKASFEAEASSLRRAVVGSRRVVVVAGERRISGNRGARSGYADAEHPSEPRNNFR
jgi:hypothetical protein